MDDKKRKSEAREALARRKGELRGEIAAVAARIAHLAAQAKAVEAGTLEVKTRFDDGDACKGREETLKFQPSAAVGYWREVRQHEERLDLKRAELRALENPDGGEVVRVEVYRMGPPPAGFSVPRPPAGAPLIGPR